MLIQPIQNQCVVMETVHSQHFFLYSFLSCLKISTCEHNLFSALHLCWVGLFVHWVFPALPVIVKSYFFLQWIKTSWCINWIIQPWKSNFGLHVSQQCFLNCIIIWLKYARLNHFNKMLPNLLCCQAWCRRTTTPRIPITMLSMQQMSLKPCTATWRSPR